MNKKTLLAVNLLLGAALSGSAQIEIVASFDTFTDIWGDGQTRRDNEPVMAARNSTTSSGPPGFQEVSGMPLAGFDISSLALGDLVGQQVLLQVALAGFNSDPNSDGVTIGAYNVLDQTDASAILYGPRVDFDNLTVAVDWAGNDYLGGASFPGVAVSRADIDLIETVDLSTSFLADAGVWNNYTETLSFDVTDIVNGWVDGSIANNGLALWIDPLLSLNQEQEQVNFTTFENTNSSTGLAGGSAPARLLIVPEPSTYALFFGILSFAGIIMHRCRKRQD